MPPQVNRTRGINTACSTSRTLSPYSLFFAFLCSLYIQGGEVFVTIGGCIWVKTLTSENASCPLDQKPRTHMSHRASSCVLALLDWKDSPLRGWRTGSTQVLWQTSARRLDETSQISCVMCSDILPCGKSWHGQQRTLSRSNTCEVVQIVTNHSGGRGRP